MNSPTADEAAPEMKTILVVNDNLQTNINGVVTLFKNIERLAHKDGYKIVYMNPSEFPHFDCPGYPDIKLSLPIDIENKIGKINPDFIHIATEGPLGLATRLYCDRRKIGYNTGYHTKIPEYLRVMYGIPESVGYGYLRWFHRNSGRVLTTTNTMVTELENHGFLSYIKPLTFGVDRSIFKSSLRHDDSKFSKLSRPILLSVGRVSKEKGLDDFCNVKYPGATKIVVGDGAYRKELEHKYPEVIFAGFQTGAALADYYANADCLVFTSRTDTFGVVIIEALAVGTPVAGYQVAGPKDILEEGVTGYMGEDMTENISKCLALDRAKVEEASMCWSWDQCWDIFRRHLVKRSDLLTYEYTV
ncbi:Aste57867_12230 [Aphanomyces stellatus]|uniref:Aste57867_12230 protein n=1 Tax=Aphanomyces stellatus TaxID=120398 RepID=A0A485KWD9_9STRA|nr:hypothetical protein As57867_012185 [Aphanomyces stellatus]VFT89084.1 Aste57867_12230 [Aphanomyces stellatus]